MENFAPNLTDKIVRLFASLQRSPLLEHFPLGALGSFVGSFLLFARLDLLHVGRDGRHEIAERLRLRPRLGWLLTARLRVRVHVSKEPCGDSGAEMNL